MIDFKFLTKNEIRWKSYGGQSHPLSSLHTLYLIRLMRVMKCNEDYPPHNEGRTKEQWYNIFKEELDRRNETI